MLTKRILPFAVLVITLLTVDSVSVNSDADESGCRQFLSLTVRGKKVWDQNNPEQSAENILSLLGFPGWMSSVGSSLLSSVLTQIGKQLTVLEGTGKTIKEHASHMPAKDNSRYFYIGYDRSKKKGLVEEELEALDNSTLPSQVKHLAMMVGHCVTRRGVPRTFAFYTEPGVDISIAPFPPKSLFFRGIGLSANGRLGLGELEFWSGFNGDWVDQFTKVNQKAYVWAHFALVTPAKATTKIGKIMKKLHMAGTMDIFAGESATCSEGGSSPMGVSFIMKGVLSMKMKFGNSAVLQKTSELVVWVDVSSDDGTFAISSRTDNSLAFKGSIGRLLGQFSATETWDAWARADDHGVKIAYQQGLAISGCRISMAFQFTLSSSQTTGSFRLQFQSEGMATLKDKVLGFITSTIDTVKKWQRDIRNALNGGGPIGWASGALFEMLKEAGDEVLTVLDYLPTIYDAFLGGQLSLDSSSNLKALVEMQIRMRLGSSGWPSHKEGSKNKKKKPQNKNPRGGRIRRTNRAPTRRVSRRKGNRPGLLFVEQATALQERKQVNLKKQRKKGWGKKNVVGVVSKRTVPNPSCPGGCSTFRISHEMTVINFNQIANQIANKIKDVFLGAIRKIEDIWNDFTGIFGQLNEAAGWLAAKGKSGWKETRKAFNDAGRDINRWANKMGNGLSSAGGAIKSIFGFTEMQQRQMQQMHAQHMHFKNVNRRFEPDTNKDNFEDEQDQEESETETDDF